MAKQVFISKTGSDYSQHAGRLDDPDTATEIGLMVLLWAEDGFDDFSVEVVEMTDEDVLGLPE